jgi:hypothetical protein
MVGTVHDVPIIPDDKNWTWVLERPCAECGFEATDWIPEDVADAVRVQATTWARLLAEPTARERSADDRWSALEYGCHVRDVFRLYDQRLVRMLAEDHPTFANWDQDETAVIERYDEQDPRIVAVELAAAAETFADRLAGVSGDQWDRLGTRSDGVTFDVRAFAVYMIHDPIHHVRDVELARGR